MREWHSILPGIEVYHNNRSCTLGDNITPKNVRPGRGGKRLCAQCATRNSGNVKNKKR